ncbi:Protein of unknown function [Roseateles sp. YR242]|uniref:DUF2809 domain-containing protein n=1 Tax=Roseateles sp. YR242 TaxID=1855305 RepID=UPI0008CF56B2|nr:DUF2809 domain-containing protein [Roseateles sp. YR242]SEK61483.1 Protein of unknown function [Roseateles sp. YR242]
MNQTSPDPSFARTLARQLAATETRTGSPPVLAPLPLLALPQAMPTRRWRWRFSGRYALAAIGIFLIEAAIATIGQHMAWLRWYAGDVIVVGFVHCLLAMVIDASTPRVALAAFAVACAVELSQYVSHVMGWTIGNPVLRVIVGSTADWMDVLSYALGTVLILVVGVLFKAARGFKASPAPYRQTGFPGSPVPPVQ